MDTFIGILCALVLVVILILSGNKLSDRAYESLTTMSYTEMKGLKKECELNLKRSETCKLVFIPEE